MPLAQACVRPARASVFLPNRKRSVSIRLRADGRRSSVDFCDDRSREILSLIRREVLAFRNAQEYSAGCPLDLTVSSPQKEWFRLVLGNVFSDHSALRASYSRSDLKYSFALPVLWTSPMVRCRGADRPERTEVPDALREAPIEIGLLLPLLWQEDSFPPLELPATMYAMNAPFSCESLCLLRMLPSGVWHGRILGPPEVGEFRQIVPFIEKVPANTSCGFF